MPPPSLAASSPTPRLPPGRASARPTLTVVWRREDRPANRLSPRDRIELLGWTAEARAFGIGRVRLEHPDPQDSAHAVGDFVLIYDQQDEWARWAVAREDGHYLLWSPSTGRTIGIFATFGAALARILAPVC